MRPNKHQHYAGAKGHSMHFINALIVVGTAATVRPHG
jgi:hypothetical protein